MFEYYTMPTPFTHLEIAQRLLADGEIPPSIRHQLCDESGAFLLGSVAADGREKAVSERQDTHFYRYDQPLKGRAWRAMLCAHPSLWEPIDNSHRVFLAAYVAHLAVDECWTRSLLRPHFAEKEWRGGETRQERFRVLHYLLSWMDERDWPRLSGECAVRLREVIPQGWLPFFADESLRRWCDLILRQLPPLGKSDTLAIFGARIGQEPTTMRAILDDEATMHARLWKNIPPRLLAEVEAQCYREARSQMLAYWVEASKDLGTMTNHDPLNCQH